MEEEKDYCGFENGEDWLVDLAIEDYLLRKEKHESKTSNLQSNYSERLDGRRNI